MKKSDFIIATIQDPKERDKLYAALDKRFAIWDSAFIVDSSGDMRPNPDWWRTRNLFHKSVLIEVQCYCKGWLDASLASKKQVL